MYCGQMEHTLSSGLHWRTAHVLENGFESDCYGDYNTRHDAQGDHRAESSKGRKVSSSDILTYQSEQPRRRLSKGGGENGGDASADEKVKEKVLRSHSPSMDSNDSQTQLLSPLEEALNNNKKLQGQLAKRLKQIDQLEKTNKMQQQFLLQNGVETSLPVLSVRSASYQPWSNNFPLSQPSRGSKRTSEAKTVAIEQQLDEATPNYRAFPLLQHGTRGAAERELNGSFYGQENATRDYYVYQHDRKLSQDANKRFEKSDDQTSHLTLEVRRIRERRKEMQKKLDRSHHAAQSSYSDGFDYSTHEPRDEQSFLDRHKPLYAPAEQPSEPLRRMQEENKRLTIDLRHAQEDKHYRLEAMRATVTEKERLAAQVEQLQLQVAQLSQQEDASRRQLEAMRDSYTGTQQRLEEENRQLIHQMEKLSTLTFVQPELQRRSFEQHSQIAALQKERENMWVELQAAKAEASGHKETLVQEQRERATTVQRLEELSIQHSTEVTELRGELQRLQTDLHQAQMEVQNQTEFWRVSPQEVHVLEENVLGRGAWGYVAEGRFRGKRVAVKCLHQEILDPHTIQRVQREICTMAHVRHPNLLLFIAAVYEPGNAPMIVTELLDMNLRRAYERDLLGSSRITIFRDVACALNYLHQHREPIIHRDVSAPNVLLEALAGGHWRAKLSDFGSANVARLCHTLGEGAVIYAAPETFPQHAVSPSAVRLPQTTKLDVYSYGVLLCEVITSQFPDPDRFADMLQQVESQWPLMYNIITSCRQYHPDERPTMTRVLNELNRIPRPSQSFPRMQAT